MSEPFSEELLSAYLDGELSPQLRSAVERWVENSSAASQKLEEFRRLSRLFGELPRSEVPPEFSNEVLHLAERRMLLPEAGAARQSRRWRNWALALAAPAVIAATLLLMLKLSNRNDPAGRPFGDTQVGEIPCRLPGDRSQIADKTHGEMYGETNREPANSLLAHNAAASPAANRPLAPGSGGALEPLDSPATPAAGASAKSTAQQKPMSVAAGGAQTTLVESDPQFLAINAAVQEIRESGNADKVLLVVTAYVVDRAEGLVLLQKDFAANNIRVDFAGETPSIAAIDAKPPHAAGKDAASSEGLYVEARADDVIAGFKTTLARRHPGLRFFVEDSIELASLDDAWKRQFSQGNAQRRADGRRGDDVAKELKSSKDSPEGAKSGTFNDEPPTVSSGRRSKQDDETSQDNKSGQSAMPRKKGPSPSNSRAHQAPGLDQGAVEKAARAAPPQEKGPEDKQAADKDADDKEAADLPESNRASNGARQMAIHALPPVIQNRARFNSGTNSQPSRNSAVPQKQNSSRNAGRNAPAAPVAAKSRDEVPLAKGSEELAEPAPAQVRILIVIEREPQQPDAPAVKKSPSGGAA